MSVAAVAALADDAAARAVAERLGLPVVTSAPLAALLLCSTPRGLGLRETTPRAPGPVVIDLVKGRVGWRKKHGASTRDPLCRALGLGRGTTTVVDATAGLLVDSMALVNAGLEVTAIERSPIVAALQEDAVVRAGGVAGLALVQGDAVALLTEWAGTARAPDAILVDPMYDDRSRKSVAPKEMRALRLAVGPDDDASALVAAAVACARRRVVVKRAKLAPALLPTPSFALTGRSTRFDVYVRT